MCVCYVSNNNVKQKPMKHMLCTNFDDITILYIIRQSGPLYTHINNVQCHNHDTIILFDAQLLPKRGRNVS